MATTVRAPFGATDVQSPAFNTTQAITITNDDTIFSPVSATDNVTLNLTIDSSVNVGATLLILWLTDGTETLTFGTAITAPVITGVAAKTHTQKFTFTGASFIATGAEIQID